MCLFESAGSFVVRNSDNDAGDYCVTVSIKGKVNIQSISEIYWPGASFQDPDTADTEAKDRIAGFVFDSHMT